MIHDGKGNIDAKMERSVERFKGGGTAMTAGAATNSGPILAYRTVSHTPPGLAYHYDSDWIGWLGGCEGDVKVEEWAIGRDPDAAEYRLHIRIVGLRRVQPGRAGEGRYFRFSEIPGRQLNLRLGRVGR